MRIYIPYATSGIGGPYTFVRLFSNYLLEQGHSVTYDASSDYDVLFVIAECPLWHVWQAKKQGKPVIQRLDGTYYPALEGLKGTFYRVKNARMQIIHNSLADHVIYQSKFCQQMCEQILGTPRGTQSLIYNGVVPNVLERQEERADRIRLVTFGKFRRAGQIVPLVKAIKKIQIPFQFDIYGPHTRSLRRMFQSLTMEPSIAYHGLKSHDELATILPKYDIFVFSDLSCCPNAVLEAQVAGLAVVTYDRGGAPELVSHQQSGMVVPLFDPAPLVKRYTFSDADAKRFAGAIETVAEDIASYKRRALTHVTHFFQFEKIAQAYEEILRSYA